MTNLPVKTVVVIAIGAALYGIGGLPVFGIPIFAETSLKPAIAILAVFSALYGPTAGFLIGLLGHGITDLFAGWGVWYTWILGSGIVGFIIGFYEKITKERLDTGEFSNKDIAIFVGLSFLGNLIGYSVSAFLDSLFFTEPTSKLIAQQLIVIVSNTILIGILGTILLRIMAKRNQQMSNLTEFEE